jgi:hypothetical protein
MDLFMRENSYGVQNFFSHLSKPTAAPNIRDRIRGSLMITENFVEVSFSGLGEVFQQHEGGTERNRKKHESE